MRSRALWILAFALAASAVLISLDTFARSADDTATTTVVGTVPSAGIQQAATEPRSVTFIDLFDGETDVWARGGNGPWDVIAGTWQVGRGVVTVTSDSVERSIATVALGASDAEISAQVGATGAKSGLVFRFADKDNYWMVLAAPAGPGWNVKKVVDGEVTDVGNLGVARASDGTNIGVRLVGSEISILVEGRVRATFTDETHQFARRAGVTATGDDAVGSSWQHFLALSHPSG